MLLRLKDVVVIINFASIAGSLSNLIDPLRMAGRSGKSSFFA
jgi:hypothetical protein